MAIVLSAFLVCPGHRCPLRGIAPFLDQAFGVRKCFHGTDPVERDGSDLKRRDAELGADPNRLEVGCQLRVDLLDPAPFEVNLVCRVVVRGEGYRLRPFGSRSDSRRKMP
jgi:hypothetical protein